METAAEALREGLINKNRGLGGGAEGDEVRNGCQNDKKPCGTAALERNRKTDTSRFKVYSQFHILISITPTVTSGDMNMNASRQSSPGEPAS